MKILKRAAALLAVAGLAAAALNAVAPSAAVAAPARVSVGAVGVGNAVDVKARGSLTTPRVSVSSNVQVASHAYTIKRSGRTVASTQTSGKRFSLRTGTYDVRTAVKYRTYADKRVATTTSEWKWVAYDYLKHRNASPESCKRTGEVDTSGLSEWTWPDGTTGVDGSLWHPATCTMDDGSKRKGVLFEDMVGGGGRTIDQIVGDYSKRYPLNEWAPGTIGWTDEFVWEEVKIPATKVVRVYSPYTTVTSRQSATIGNSGVMSHREYKKIKDGMRVSAVNRIVGGPGVTVREYRTNKADYLVRSWTDTRRHVVKFKNRRVYEKSWA